jgi:broad specificity phosphatase PhoE
MTTILLVRHCAFGALGRYLAGRAPNEHLDETGRAHVARITKQFTGVTLDAVFSSPLERARQTAEALAACTAGGVTPADELLELDFGEWTGKRFDELHADPRWARFNTHRTTTRIPGGEHILEVQARAVGFIDRVAAQLPQGRVAMVTHGDVIRATLCHYLGLPLDAMQRFEISPGSFSRMSLGESGPTIEYMNVVDADVRTGLGL